MNILFPDQNGNPMPVFYPGITAPIIVDGTSDSAATAAVIDAKDKQVVRLWADNDCHIAIGANPTATTSDIPISGGISEYLVIESGCKIAVLGAKLYINVHKG